MPRSVHDILQHADDLARRFETYEPRPGDEIPAEVYTTIQQAVAERAAAEQHMAEAVRDARGAGLSWAKIGALVGTSGEAARQKYRAMAGKEKPVTTGG